MYDLAVIGGGIVGCFAALRAAELKLHSILIDARTVFGGSSPRSAGVFTVQLDTPLDAELVYESIKLVKKYSREAWRETGFLQIGRKYSLRDSIESLRKCGIRFEVLSNDEIADRWPNFIVEPSLMGVYTDMDLSVEPKLLGRELRTALLERGVEVAEGLPVVAIEADLGRVESVRLSDSSRVSAENFVFATGAWSKELLSQFNPRIETFLLTCFAFRIRLGEEISIPSFSDEYLHTYWRPWDNSLVGGGYYAEFAELPDLSDAAPPHNFYKTSLKLLLKRLRLDKALEPVEHMRGPCSFTNDGLPIFGFVPHLKNAFMIDGLGGYGLMRGAALGYLAVDCLIEGHEPQRFKSFSPLRAQSHLNSK